MKPIFTLTTLVLIGAILAFTKDTPTEEEYITATINKGHWSAKKPVIMRNSKGRFKGAIGDYNGAKIILVLADTARGVYSLKTENVSIRNFRPSKEESH